MHLLQRSFTVAAISCGMAIVSAPPAFAAPNGGFFQYAGERYGDLRGLVERTQSDVQQASQFSHFKGDQRSRFENTQRHLSTFDRHLTKGHFDKHQLDDAIADVQKIIDKNTLQASSRDALMRDISDLRAARERRY